MCKCRRHHYFIDFIYLFTIMILNNVFINVNNTLKYIFNIMIIRVLYNYSLLTHFIFIYYYYYLIYSFIVCMYMCLVMIAHWKSRCGT